MPNFPESIDIFTDKVASDAIGSSDPNVAYDAIEATQGLIGALGKAQSWSTTLITLLRKYRSGLEVEVSGGVLYVRKGEAVLENTNAALYEFRRNTADHTVVAANLDVGTLAVNTYYMYAWGGTVATTAPIIFSTDVNAPSNSVIGTSPYRQLGYFWNQAAGVLAVTYVSGGDTPVKREDVYDSGWFAIALNSTYPVTHNLGTIKCLVTVMGANNLEGLNAGGVFVRVWGADYPYTGLQYTQLTTTTVIVRLGGEQYLWDGTAYGTVSHARILMLALD